MKKNQASVHKRLWRLFRSRKPSVLSMGLNSHTVGQHSYNLARYVATLQHGGDVHHVENLIVLHVMHVFTHMAGVWHTNAIVLDTTLQRHVYVTSVSSVQAPTGSFKRLGVSLLAPLNLSYVTVQQS